MTISPYLVKPGSRLSLSKIDPNDSGSWVDKATAKSALSKVRDRIEELQERLYAEHKQLCLLSCRPPTLAVKMARSRASSKGLPAGCPRSGIQTTDVGRVDYDFLWRIHQQVPAKGMITVFNRSHYEDVLVVRVKKLVPKQVWSARYDVAINDFERQLSRNGTRVIKFYSAHLEG